MDNIQKVTPYAAPKVPTTVHAYSKAFVAAIGVILTGLNALYGTNPYVQLAIGLATTLGVYAVPNKNTL